MAQRTHLTIAAAAVLLGTGLALAFWAGSGARPERNALDLEPEEAQVSADADPDAFDLEDGDEDAEPFVSSARASLGAEPDPAALEDAGAEVAAIATAVPPGTPRVRPRGTLVDAATGGPLADYRIQVTDRAQKKLNLRTDEEGRFESEDALFAGPIQVWFSEVRWGPGAIARLEMGPGADPEESGFSAPLALETQAGPTYRIALRPASVPAADEFGAQLRFRVGGGFQSVGGTPRAGAPDWIRFSPLPAGDVSEANLLLSSFDGLWWGRASVEVRPGVVPGVVTVQLEARAAIEARVLDAQGQPLENAFVALRIERAEGDPDERRARTGRDGAFQMQHLVAGSATLSVKLQRHHNFELALELLPGKAWKQDVHMARLPSAGAIRGVVLSDTGTYREDVWLRLVRPEDRDGPPPIDTKVAWTEKNGAYVGSFALEDLPPGAWQMFVSERDWFEWEPRRQEVHAPLDNLVLRVRDGVPVADLVFRARPAAEGGPRADFEARVVTAGERRTASSRGGVAVFESVPVDQALSWRVDAPGRATEFGDLASFAPAGTAEGRARRTYDLELREGWCERLRVIRSTDRKPVEGATIRIEGRAAGTTDAGGYATVRAPRRPREVEIEWKDWTVQGRVDLRPPRRGSYDMERTVRIQPPRRAKKQN